MVATRCASACGAGDHQVLLMFVLEEDLRRRRGTGLAGERLQVDLQDGLPGRGRALELDRRDGHVGQLVMLEAVGAGGADQVLVVLVKGLPGGRMRSGSSVLESTERVRTEAKRALVPGCF